MNTEEKREEWTVITDLIYVGLNMLNPTMARVEFSRYVDEKKKMLHGATIGYSDGNGRIVVIDPRKHKVVVGKFPKDTDEDYYSDKSYVIWLEKKEALE